MNRVLRAIVISATATTAAAVAMSIIKKSDATEPKPRQLSSDEQFQDLDAEQTEALVAELAAQV